MMTILLYLFLSVSLVFGSSSNGNNKLANPAACTISKPGTHGPSTAPTNLSPLRPPTSPLNPFYWYEELRREESNGYTSSKDCSPVTVPSGSLKRKKAQRLLVDSQFSSVPFVSDGEVGVEEESFSFRKEDGIAGNNKHNGSMQRHFLMNIDEFSASLDSIPDFDTSNLRKKE